MKLTLNNNFVSNASKRGPKSYNYYTRIYLILNYNHNIYNKLCTNYKEFETTNWSDYSMYEITCDMYL